MIQFEQICPHRRPKPEPLFLIAAGRSGTNALRTALQGSESIDVFHETFHPLMAGRLKNHFFEFREEWLREHGPSSDATESASAQMFDAYLNWCAERTNKPIFLIDPKIGCLRSLDRSGTPLLTAPLMIRRIVARGDPVLHLTRRDRLAQYCSHRIAAQTNQWVVLNHQERQRISPIKLNISEVESVIDKLDADDQAIRKWLSRSPRQASLVYEELFEDGVLSELARSTIQDLIAQPIPKGLRPKTEKIVVSLPEMIESYDNIARQIKSRRRRRGILDWPKRLRMAIGLIGRRNIDEGEVADSGTI